MFFVRPALAGAVRKSEGFVFLVQPSNPVSKSFINGIIIFQTTTALLQDLQIVSYVVLIFTNRLSAILVFENRAG